MKKLITLLFVLGTLHAVAQSGAAPNVKFRNPEQLVTPKGYTHAVEIDLGNSKMVLISGEVALDKQGNLVGKDDLAKQSEQVFNNIKTVVEDAGGTMDNLVKIGIFLVDLSQLQTFVKVRDRFINAKQRPASTMVQVSRLYRDDLLVEIEATAIIPKKP